jgi:predicted TIM-barrel enzyme
MEGKLKDIFQTDKIIIGMIHLAGRPDEKVKRALEELAIYEEEGVNGAIIEDYHGTPLDIYETLKESSKMNFKIIRGVNLLQNPYRSFEEAHKFDAKFVQFDSVQTENLRIQEYDRLRKEYPKIAVLGGVGFKYIKPTGNPLSLDLNEGKQKCEAIVTTGSGTGIETPLEKLKEYKILLGNFPLIVGAGVNLYNVKEQLKVCDGAIVGSYFKPYGHTQLKVDQQRVHDFMRAVREIR